jgi:hypothetical protein
MFRRTFLGLTALACLPQLAFAADPPPDSVLSSIQGNWGGSLQYKDYSAPDRLVTLPTKLSIALSAPDEITMHYEYDDGPKKMVYSYERMRFDFAKNEAHWKGGSKDKPVEMTWQITKSVPSGASRLIVMERARSEGKKDRLTFELSPAALSFAKDEIATDGQASFRNKYTFKRP